MSLGENIRKRRESVGMTQQTLAGEVRITIPAISQFEHNIRIPNAFTFAEIARALGVTMDALMYGDTSDGGKK